MKLCVIGGAGARSVFLAKSLVTNAAAIQVDHIVFMDINENKLNTYGILAKKTAFALNPKLRFDLTADIKEALRNTDYIITTMRVGNDEGRVFDEKLCLDYGVLGQETTGAGGFAMALRSVPALLSYCKLAKEIASPNHIIFNFTNPSGIITQALRSSGYHNVFGICDAPSGFQKQLEEMLGAAPDELTMECYGLNHFSWFRNASLHGKNIQEELLQNPKLYRETEMRLFDQALCRLNGNCMLNEYLYFYYRRNSSYKKVRSALHPRGESIYLINLDLEKKLNVLDVETDFEQAFRLYMESYAKRENAYFSVESGEIRPKTWTVPSLEEFISSKDEGGYAAVALKYILGVTTGKGSRMVLSIPNQGAINGLEADDVVEITCNIDKDGAHPIQIGEINEFQYLQMKRIKYFERCTIQAALHHDREAAVQGLYLHPLVNDLEIAKALTDAFFYRYASYFA